MALFVKSIVAGVAVLLVTAAPAMAYRESTTLVPSDTAAYSCPSCHGLESGTTSPTVAATRKGPHGGYTTGTNKCQTCHSVHNSAAGGRALLPEATIQATCETCHDGTGGGGVYGVIKQRTGSDPGAAHKMGVTSIPGGDVDGGSLTVTFSGEGGGLTCTDCHSPHDSATVEPFIGDRLRTEDDTTSGGIATNRLLKQQPSPSMETTTAVYGTEWCSSCHQGLHNALISQVRNHPVGDTSDGLDYNNVYRMAGYGSASIATTLGPLGGSNLGYIVPKALPSNGHLPICQQCHEDSRASIGNVTPLVVAPSEAFNPSLDGTSTAGNPRFQNFPHETQNAKLLVELGTNKAKDTLCLNCHKQGN